MATVDITNQQFGFLIAREKVPRPENANQTLRCSWWRCECKSCGGEKIVPLQYLKQGSARHCGCRNEKRRALSSEMAVIKATRDKEIRKATLNERDNLYGLLKTCRCAECGKIFERASWDWAYKRKTAAGKMLFYCTWKCFRARETKNICRGNVRAARELG